ncbi:hypothetical protein [Nocardia sp. NRRL S-836]|uniref:hypothetical protein n=1 Tax=Nocardia sp. NRRL S-836 TaxID=1519492 RepID=UPI0006B01C32|nr:hypothetical protein [Nocardia sp. NRRL S-836]KOV84284.1 hypothetical protein ADL03_16985 [Nocardia sp. NRRL S-836]
MIRLNNRSASLAVLSPLAASMYVAGMPWYACVLLGALGMSAYGVRHYLLYRLGSKALDKAAVECVPEVMQALAAELNDARPSTPKKIRRQ